MSKKNINTNRKYPSKENPNNIVAAKPDLLEILNDYFTRRENLILYFGLCLALIISLLLFDLNVSPGGDDSAYISRAYDLVHGFIYPGFQGPLYPFALSIFIFFEGINIVILKLFSLGCILVALWFFYKTLSQKLPQAIVSISFILLCINYSLLYYSSQTYSEAFYLMLQSIFIWFAVKKFADNTFESQAFINHLILGFLAFILTLTRNIAYAAVIGMVGYFLMNKKWKSTIKFIGSFSISFMVYEVFKRLIWGNTIHEIASQASAIKYKKFYNPSMGNEDFIGYINRFIDNSASFFSTHLFNFMGLRMEATENNTFLMIGIWALIIYAFYIGIRKSKIITLICTYTIAMCVVSFLAVQKDWNQSRMIIIYLPFFFIMLFSVIYFLTKDYKFKIFQVVVPLMAFLLFYTSFNITGKNIGKQKQIIDHNLRGDILYGLTPDWKNYIIMSKWAASHTPKGYFTAVRKSDISFIYTERKFYGITKLPMISTDSLLQITKGPLHYVGIQMNDLIKTQLYKNPKFRSNLISVVNGLFTFGKITGDNNIVGIFGFNDGDFKNYISALQINATYYETDIKSWVELLRQNKEDFGIYMPDALYQQLRKEKVKNILLASLRSDPTQKTDRIISTVHRYVYYIQLKYPEKFQLKQRMGTDEKAELVEIKY